jgi:hypothetical protein
VSVGGVLGDAWQLYTRFFMRFFVIAAIVSLVVNLLNAIVGSLVGSGAGAAVLLAFISVLVSLVGTFWLQGALVYAATAGSTRRCARCSTASGRSSGR